MNSRDRVRAALTCRTPDRIPMALAFWEESLPAIAPRTPAEHFRLDVRFVESAPPDDQQDFLRYLGDLPPDVHVGDLSQLRIYHEWGYHPELGPDGPLASAHSAAELARYTFPDLVDPLRYTGLRTQIEQWHAQGWAVAGSPPHLGGELFESGYRLRGFTNFLADLVRNKPLAHYLLDQLTALMLHSALVLARAGVDILLLDDDVAMPTGLIIGPTTWREFFKPRLADVIRLAREAQPELLIFYHSDGDFTAIVADLVEVGVNVINPLQPDCMDALTIKERFGDRLALWGTVGSAALWDHGTPAQIRAEVKHRIETLGPAGLLLSPAYDLDYAPFENIAAFVDAVREFGRTAATLD
jgi:uroporphyrinogen decarboxylase